MSKKCRSLEIGCDFICDKFRKYASHVVSSGLNGRRWYVYPAGYWLAEKGEKENKTRAREKGVLYLRPHGICFFLLFFLFFFRECRNAMPVGRNSVDANNQRNKFWNERDTRQNSEFPFTKKMHKIYIRDTGKNLRVEKNYILEVSISGSRKAYL